MKYKIKIKKTVEATVVINKENKEEVEQWATFAVKNDGIKFDESTTTCKVEYL